jgi:hypothetical protein
MALDCRRMEINKYYYYYSWRLTLHVYVLLFNLFFFNTTRGMCAENNIAQTGPANLHFRLCLSIAKHRYTSPSMVGNIPNYRLILYYRPGACTPAVMMSQQWRLGSDLGLVYSRAKNIKKILPPIEAREKRVVDNCEMRLTVDIQRDFYMTLTLCSESCRLLGM